MTDRSQYFRGPPPSLGRIPEHLREAARRGIAKARKALEQDNDATEGTDG